jgi:hypothetical protein
VDGLLLVVVGGGAGVDEVDVVVGGAGVDEVDVVGGGAGVDEVDDFVCRRGAGLLEPEVVELGTVVSSSSAGWFAEFSFAAQDHRVLLVVFVTNVSTPGPCTAVVTSAWA